MTIRQAAPGSLRPVFSVEVWLPNAFKGWTRTSVTTAGSSMSLAYEIAHQAIDKFASEATTSPGKRLPFAWIKDHDVHVAYVGVPQQGTY